MLSDKNRLKRRFRLPNKKPGQAGLLKKPIRVVGSTSFELVTPAV